MFDNNYFMQMALNEAKRAFEKGEVPIGAVVTCQNRIIAKAHNLTQTLNDITAHAEMQAITAAANFLGGKYLNSCSIYVSLEPCPMCAGALFWAQIGKLFYAAHDPKRGYNLFTPVLLHPKTEIVSGILATESETLLKCFFETKRKPK